MLCKRCNADIPDTSRYCSNCGGKILSESPDEMLRRLSAVEERLDKQDQKRSVEQKVLDLETSEQVVTRIMKWAQVFAFFVGIPLALVLFAFVVIVGKSAKDLSGMASNARESVRPLLESARLDAEKAKSTAAQALQESEKVGRDVDSTKRTLSELRNSVVLLTRDIGNSQAQVARLRTEVAERSNQVRQLSQQVQTANRERNIAAVREMYPAFGERVAGTRQEWIDASRKKTDEIYVALLLDVSAQSKPRLDESKIANVIASFKEENFHVFLGPIGLHVTSGRTSQGVTQFDESACSLVGINPPPCIIYFREEMKTIAGRVREVARPAQWVPDDRIRHSDPLKLDSNKQELLRKAGLDILIVLGGR